MQNSKNGYQQTVALYPAIHDEKDKRASVL